MADLVRASMSSAGPADPAYRVLADALRLAIVDGRILHGTRLPSERSLTAALEVSRTTVTRAYDDLRGRAYLQSRQGSGTMAALPGGPAPSGVNLLPVTDDSSMIDLTCACPPAVPGLTTAYAEALDELPAHLAGAGYHPMGLPVLREAIARWFVGRGLQTSPDQIMVVPGALAGLSVVARAYLTPADRVVLEDPNYPNSVRSLRRVGARPIAWPVPHDLSQPVDLASLAALVAQGSPAIALLAPDFHNPTSRLVGDEDREAMAGILRQHRVVPVVDETLVEVALDEVTAANMPAPFAAHAPTTITIGSASKSHWGGIRIGWVRAPHSAMPRLLNARVTLDLGAPVVEQLALARLVGDDTARVWRRAQSRARRDLVLGLLRERLPDWRAEVPRGGLALWCDLGEPRGTPLVAAAERAGVLLAAGSVFAVSGRGLDHRLRLPYTVSAADLERSVDVLAELWSERGRDSHRGVSGRRTIVA